MKLVNKNDYVSIDSNTCGNLIELLNSPDAPVSITVAENIKPTKKHYHKVSTEIYWVETGFIKMNVSDKEIDLETGAILVIEPKEKHAVIEASENNKVIVISSPRWELDDEVVA